MRYFHRKARTIGTAWTQLSWSTSLIRPQSASGGGSGGTFSGAIELRRDQIAIRAGDPFTDFSCVTFQVGKGSPLACITDNSAFASDGLLQGQCDGQTPAELLVSSLTRCEAEPVNTATGAYETGATDLVADGAMPFALSRRYSSSDPSTGYFGKGWSSILEMRLLAASPSSSSGFGAGQGAGLSRRPSGQGGLYVGDGYPPIPCFMVPEGDPLPEEDPSGHRAVGAIGADDLSGSLRPVQGRGVILRAANGAQIRFFVDGEDYRGQAGVTATLRSIDGGGFELVTSDQTSFSFGASGELTGSFDRNGNGYSITWDGGFPVSVQTTSGRTVELSFAGERLRSAESNDGRVVSFGYNDGLLTSATAPDGRTTSYSYQEELLSQIRDGMDRPIVTNEYDGTKVIAQTDAEGNLGTFDYEAGKTTFTDSRGGAWVDTYAGNVLTSSFDGAGGRTIFTRDMALDLVRVTDPRGKVWTYGYDHAHNLTSVAGPPGTGIETTATYDAANNPTQLIDGRGNITTFSYDTRGNLTLIDREGDADTTIEPDADTGLPRVITNPNGHETTLSYNGSDQLISIQPELGEATTLGYDAAGNLASVTDPRGNRPGADPADFTTSFSFDAARRPTGSIDPLGNRTQLLYDEAGKTCRVLDPNASAQLGLRPAGECEDAGAVAGESTYLIDARGDLEEIRAPDQGLTDFHYDSTGNLEEVLDANGKATTYTFDAARRVQTETTPITSRSFTYIPGGLPETVTLANGAVTTFGYDNASRLSSIDYTMSNTPDVDFGYDENSNRTSMSDGAGTESYEYDDLNRLTEISRPGTGSIDYSYDDASNITQRRYPGGREVDYTFDANERLKTVTETGETTAYDYDVAGRVIETAYPNGWRDTYDYDRAGRLDLLQTVKGADVLNSFDYTRDGVGNPTQIASEGRMDRLVFDQDLQQFVSEPTPDETTYFAYDEAYRLTGACFGAPCDEAPAEFVSYSYDLMGNRQTETTQDGSFSYTYNAADQLVFTDKPSEANPDVARVIEYDERGNMITDGSHHFVYDQAGSRLKEQFLGQGLRFDVDYEFDGDGKRLAAEVHQGGPHGPPRNRDHRHEFLWDPAFGLPVLVGEGFEEAGGGQPDEEYSHLYGNGLISTWGGADSTYNHPDGIGSVAGLTDAAGDAGSRISYEPFGEVRRVDELGAGGSSPFGFTGQLLDPTGLYHMRARQYDPSVGRFISTDPLGWSPGSGAYAFAALRPGVRVDPSGLWAIGVCAGADGFIGALAGLVLDDNDCLVATSSLDFGITHTAGGATPAVIDGEVVGASASVHGGVFFSPEAECVEDLGGAFEGSGGGGGLAVGGSVYIQSGTSSRTAETINVYGAQISAGFGGGLYEYDDGHFNTNYAHVELWGETCK